MPSQRIFCFLQSLHALKVVLRVDLVSFLLAELCEAGGFVCTVEAPIVQVEECGSDWQRFRMRTCLVEADGGPRDWHLLCSFVVLEGGTAIEKRAVTCADGTLLLFCEVCTPACTGSGAWSGLASSSSDSKSMMLSDIVRCSL